MWTKIAALSGLFAQNGAGPPISFAWVVFIAIVLLLIGALLVFVIVATGPVGSGVRSIVDLL